ERDFGVVKPAGFELNLGSARAAAEEIDSAALADHVYGPLPGFGFADSFNHDIASAFLRRECANSVDHIRGLGGLDDLMGAHRAGSLGLAVALHDGDDVTS